MCCELNGISMFQRLPVNCLVQEIQGSQGSASTEGGVLGVSPYSSVCGSWGFRVNLLIPGQSMWYLWWIKWHWDGFSPSTSVFPSQFRSTGALLQGKTKKKPIFFITGLHIKPQGCGASVASAAGPFKKNRCLHLPNGTLPWATSMKKK
jgi:hypothetical protein